jgi:diguanylate cyclase (GGDEF)-like protein/PAS domain S-box-containing protein
MSDKYEFIVNASQDFITLINRDYIYEVVNESYAKVIGKPRKDILHSSVSNVWGKEKFEGTLKKYLDKSLAGEEIHYIEKFKFGLEMKYMHISYYPYFEDDKITHVLVYSHDITKLGEIESKLINYEYRDPLTGLFNRKSLDIILDMELVKAKRSKSENRRGILFITIENLADINRKHGHSIGSVLLENTGMRIKEAVRDSDYVFRFDGDELVVILSSLARNTDAVKVAHKISEQIAMPYNYKNFELSLKCYIGISIYPEDAENKESLIDKAVAALDEARRNDSAFMQYDPTIHARAIEKLELERDLNKAFFEDQFELYFQPIVTIDGVLTGGEALIRWQHPERGLVPPNDFIFLAEEIGLINEIGKWVLYTTTKHLAEWTKKRDLYISVNLTAREYENINLFEIVKSALKQAGNLDPTYLKLEITETLGMRDPEKSLKFMNELTRIGIEIFIDDFGTGVSSLSYLKDLPASTLKIDKAFIDNITTSPSDVDYLEHIIRLIKSRDKKIVIEGVDNIGQHNILKKLPVDRLQGYYFSRPVNAPDFEKLFTLEKLPQ